MKGVLIPVRASEGSRGVYRSLQCALCHTLGSDYGFRYRLFAGPDMVFAHALGDALGAGLAPLGKRACVLAPGVSKLPVRARTERTTLAAAIGVYLGIAKLQDDVDDEGGLVHRLAAWAFAPGRTRAEAALQEAGFPLALVEAELKAQRALELGPVVSVEEAAGPTARIAAAVFGAFGADAASEALGRDIGRRVGRALFWLDGALDLPADLRLGRYNALARAEGLGVDALPEALLAVRASAVAAARAEVKALAALVQLLPAETPAALVRATVVDGLNHQLQALDALPMQVWATASHRTVQPAKAGVSQVWGAAAAPVWARAKAVLAQRVHRVTMRPRLVLALGAMALFPSAAWPAKWWPDPPADGLIPLPPPGLDETGLPDDSGFVDTGLDPGPSDAGDSSGGCSDWVLNPCLASCGYADCDPGKCCENACDGVCDDTCADVNCDCG